MTATPHLTQSNGGVIGFATAAAMPVRTVLSGPSTGVVGAQAIGRAGGLRRTSSPSTWAAPRPTSRCCRAAAAGSPREADVHGYPIKAPMLDIHTVGAGGGSIAYIDSGGLLKVGPRCAGADPGPACYDKGNDGAHRHRRQRRAADAEPEHLLGGRMKIRQDLARAGDRAARRASSASA